MKRALCITCIVCAAATFCSCAKKGDISSSGISLSVNAPESDWLIIEAFDPAGRKAFVATVTDLGDLKDMMEKPDSVGGHPAKIYPDRAIWVCVKDRFRIHVDADPGVVPEYKKTVRLREFALLFDLDGLSKIAGAEKLKSQELQKYMPHLKVVQK